MKRLVLALALLPAFAFADPLKVEHPMVPLAPPSAQVHAAYMVLHNESADDMQLIGVSAEGYAMAHLHKSEEKNGVATMSAVHMIEITAGSHVTLEQGGLHIMLMRPDAPAKAGDQVAIELAFADGTTQTVMAEVHKMDSKMMGHAHHHHGS